MRTITLITIRLRLHAYDIIRYTRCIPVHPHFENEAKGLLLLHAYDVIRYTPGIPVQEGYPIWIATSEIEQIASSEGVSTLTDIQSIDGISSGMGQIEVSWHLFCVRSRCRSNSELQMLRSGTRTSERTNEQTNREPNSKSSNHG
jgi:hypothetical protein